MVERRINPEQPGSHTPTAGRCERQSPATSWRSCHEEVQDVVGEPETPRETPIAESIEGYYVQSSSNNDNDKKKKKSSKQEFRVRVTSFLRCSWLVTVDATCIKVS